jgi:hypothetical protein
LNPRQFRCHHQLNRLILFLNGGNIKNRTLGTCSEEKN